MINSMMVDDFMAYWLVYGIWFAGGRVMQQDRLPRILGGDQEASGSAGKLQLWESMGKRRGCSRA